jgi:hypothetical protein
MLVAAEASTPLTGFFFLSLFSRERSERLDSALSRLILSEDGFLLLDG